MAGAEAGAVVAVEVLVEENVVAPLRIVLEGRLSAEDRAVRAATLEAAFGMSVSRRSVGGEAPADASARPLGRVPRLNNPSAAQAATYIDLSSLPGWPAK